MSVMGKSASPETLKIFFFPRGSLSATFTNNRRGQKVQLTDLLQANGVTQ